MIDLNLHKVKLEQPNLHKKLFFAVNGDLLLQLPATEEEIEEFNSIKKKLSYQCKYFQYMHNMHEYGRKELMEDNKICFYYIPDDVYHFLYYHDGHMRVKNTVPIELKEKAINCARWIDGELNYAMLNLNLLILNGKEIGIKCNKGLSPIIIIKKNNENRISVTLTYNDIINSRYIKYYNSAIKTKKEQLISNHAID